MSGLQSCLLLVVLISSIPGHSDPVARQLRERPVTELRLDSETLLARSKSIASDAPLQTATIIDLCELHREVVRHSQFGNGGQLESVRARIATRLKSLARELKRASRVQVDGAGNGTVSPSSKFSESSRSATKLNWYEVLRFQQQNVEFLECWLGGPGQQLSFLPGNYAPPFDHGPELVNLIETTIQSDFWIRHGGDGRIHYYQPERILVVSGTTEIQEQTTELLNRLRGLSR